MIFSVLLYSIQLILPFMGILIIYCCFKSLFESISPVRALIALKNKSTGEKIPITYWENSFGRDKHCDIVVDSPTASRSHAVLYRREEGWIIADTNSKAGIYLNGKLVKCQEKVLLGDVIEIGNMEYELIRADDLNTPSLKNKIKKQVHKSYSSFSLLIFITIFQFLAALSACFAKETFNNLPMLTFLFISGISWLSFLITNFGFRRVNFELETLGIFLSGIGIMTACCSDIKEVYTQVIAFSAGIVLFNIMIFVLKDPDFCMKLRPYLGVLALILFAVNLIFGKVKNGSQNWIMLGKFSFQPSEFIKIIFIFFGASTLRGIQTTKNLTWFILFSAACMGSLFLMGDFGTAGIFFVTFILIAFMRSGSFRTVFLTISSAIFGFLFILKFKPYIVTRFSAWRHVWEHINDTGYQQTRVLTYSASGGLLGLGLGKGCLKYVFAATSDLVFGMLCEEWGFLLALTILLSIAGLGIYSRKASLRSRSAFYSICSCCAAGMLVFQMMMNVFGVVDLFPLTGVTLPFISLGGSSMISVWGMLAFIKSSDERTYAVKK